MRLECKHWYWQSRYEVASAGFDSYALAHASAPAARTALHNLLYQVRMHFHDGHLSSHHGFEINFQCPIFWTAHLAWLVRAGVANRFDGADALVPFAFRFEGHELFSNTTPKNRTLVNARWQVRNFNEGTIENGLPSRASWYIAMPQVPSHLLFSARETLNHTWYALRGGYTLEALTRKWRFWREAVVMLLPRYDVRYGRVLSLSYADSSVRVEVTPATKYGTLASERMTLTL